MTAQQGHFERQPCVCGAQVHPDDADYTAHVIHMDAFVMRGLRPATEEGRCSGELCSYTLPLIDGLVVGHSKTGVLDVCEGGGRPPLPPTPTLVAACENVVETTGARCTGRIRYRWGQSDAPCDTCGGRCGIAVAAWTEVVRP